MKSRRLWWGISALAAVLLAGGCFAYLWYTDNRMPNFTSKVELYVYPGMPAADVQDVLERSARKPSSVARTFKSKKVEEYMQPGHYTVMPSNSSVYAARMLNNGWQSPVHVSLAGNLRLKGNIASKISSQLLVDSATVRAALDDDALLSEYGSNSRDVFALLMPATYEMYWTATVRDFLDKQKAANDVFWTSERQSKAEALGMTRIEVAVLASIVNGETNNEAEMPLIAGVYLNRLKSGWPLQADPTVAFCFDYSLGRILNKHLSVDSPYNTYKPTGLPPGPICVPTNAALDAVLNPDFGGERGRGNMFFCASVAFDGTHVFARTLSEHNRNAEAFRRELTRRSKLKK